MFNEQVVVYHPGVEGKRYVITKGPIESAEQIYKRKSAFQKKREKMKALLHLNHLLRKARREEKKTKRKARERAKHDEQA